MADLTSEHIQETISALGDRARKAEARAEQAERERDEARVAYEHERGRVQRLIADRRQDEEHTRKAEARAENLEVRVEAERLAKEEGLRYYKKLYDHAQALTRALAFYAEVREYNRVGGDPPDAPPPILTDKGSRARTALAETSPPPECNAVGSKHPTDYCPVHGHREPPPQARAEECPGCGSKDPAYQLFDRYDRIRAESIVIDAVNDEHRCRDPFHSPPESDELSGAATKQRAELRDPSGAPGGGPAESVSAERQTTKHTCQWDAASGSYRFTADCPACRNQKRVEG